MKENDTPDLHIMNIDPDVLLTIPIKKHNGVFLFPVAHRIPAMAMGSGLGSTENSGDYDIMSPFSKGLKIGDFVAIVDHYCKVGPCYHDGAVTIGIIIHGECLDPGHGPGVLPIMTTKSKDVLSIYISSSVNLKNYL